MNEEQASNRGYSQDNPYQHLTRWLQHVYTLSPAEKAPQIRDKPSLSSNREETEPAEWLIESDYHPKFYQQLPNFILSLLQNDSQTMIQFAPLLYHLAGCRACHQAYLELYGPIHDAFHLDTSKVVSTKITRPLADVTPRLLARLCRLLIGQAEAVLLQAQEEGNDRDTHARSLLQQAIQIGMRISPNSMRNQALSDLVRVANLSTSAGKPASDQPHYIASVGTDATHHASVMRRGELIGQEPQALYLQSNAFKGFITKDQDILLLHLQELDKTLYGHHILVSVALGPLIDPIQWTGGNPQQIHSTDTVDERGTIQLPLGRTALRLNDPEERSLLEIIFLQLEVRGDK